MAFKPRKGGKYRRVPSYADLWKPNSRVRFANSPYLSLAGPLTGQPATVSSFLIAARLYTTASGTQRIIKADDGGEWSEDPGTVLTTLNLSIFNTGNRLACSSFSTDTDQRFGIGASLTVPDAPATNGDSFPTFNEYLFVASGAVNQALQLYHHDGFKWQQNSASQGTAWTSAINSSSLANWWVGADNAGGGDNYRAKADYSGVAVWLAANSSVYVPFSSASKDTLLLNPSGWDALGTPHIWFHGAASAWETNAGSGGTFTLTGTLTDV